MTAMMNNNDIDISNTSPTTRKAPQTISIREWSQLPPTDFQSAFTFQQKQHAGISFASNTDRFKRDKPGSYFAIGTAEPSSFKLNNKYHQPKVPPSEEVPKHRPLWLSELRKEVPAGAQYNLDQAIGSKKTLLKTRAATLMGTGEKHSRTCDIQRDIKIYNQNSDADARGVASYDVERGLRATKKHVPVFSQSKAKQFELWAKETKRGQETPAPGQYKHDDKAVRPQRFDNVHMGTDKKTTLKDINLSPGPGHYTRVDEQYPRTFHHATKHGSSFIMSPTMSNFGSSGNFPQAAQLTQDLNQQTLQDIAEAKRSSIQQNTVNHFSIAPKGNTADQYFDTMMSTGMSQITRKLQQPPMMVGKGKVPSDLACVIQKQAKAGHQKHSPRHRTIDHNRTSSSFVNTSFNEKFGGQMSPFVDNGDNTGRQSFFAKKAYRQSPTKERHFSPKQRSLVVQNAQSADNFAENKRNKQKMNNSQQEGAVTARLGKSKDYINVADGEPNHGSKLKISLNTKLEKTRNKARKANLTNFTAGTTSDVSTTVMAPSQNMPRKQFSLGEDFTDFGAELISATPRVKHSIDFQKSYRREGSSPSSIFKNNSRAETLQSKSNLGHRQPNRKQSLLNRSIQVGLDIKRGSARNILNPGGLTHFNFI